jgi:hypothetical protein
MGHCHLYGNIKQNLQILFHMLYKVDFFFLMPSQLMEGLGFRVSIVK